MVDGVLSGRTGETMRVQETSVHEGYRVCPPEIGKFIYDCYWILERVRNQTSHPVPHVSDFS